MTRFERNYHSFRMLLCGNPRKRTAYIKKHQLFGAMGEKCRWEPWHLPLYPELIKLHDNVIVHRKALLVTHDMVNVFLAKCKPGTDFGAREKLGCIEIMDNVYISMGVVILPNVRIGRNCIIAANSTVVSDIPENSIVAGNPAKIIGRFDTFLAMRKIQANQNVRFKNHELPSEVSALKWEQFYKKRGGKEET